jgi:hypothetical protein
VFNVRKEEMVKFIKESKREMRRRGGRRRRVRRRERMRE